MNSLSTRLTFSLRWAGWHLLASAFVALLTAGVVFLFWYPGLYRALLGVAGVYLIIVLVDVVCGPLLTMVLANPAKSRRELITDVSLVALVQIAALLFGLHVVWSARPVLAVFERDRFVLVRASEIEKPDLAEAPDEFRDLSWFGPKMASTRAAKDGPELLAGVEMSLQGRGPSLRPGWWAPYEPDVPEVLRRAGPIVDLVKRHPDAEGLIADAVRATGLTAEALRYLPLVAGKAMNWSALIDPEGRIAATVPLDGFSD